jgi:enamine deaminase RidA (YjgF/YER057c/UK114 family)
MTTPDLPGPRRLRPSEWAPPLGYGNGVVASGQLVVLAGQVGWNPETAAFESDDFVAQTRQALANVVRLLAEGGAEPRHLVRLNWYVVDRAAYMARRRELGVVYREVIGLHYPPMTLVFVSGLVEERALVEIEATAVLPA